MEPTPRKIKFKTIDNKVIPLELPPDTLIKDIKAKLDPQIAPKEQLRFIYHGKPLKDDSKLSEYITADDDTIHVITSSPQPTTQPSAQPQPPPNPMPQVENIFSNMLRGLFTGGATMAPPSIYATATIINNPQNQNIPQPQPNPNPSSNEAQEAPQQVQLNYGSIYKLEQLINQLSSGSALQMIHAPSQSGPKTSIMVIGNYLSNLSHQTLKLLPCIQKMGELFAKEALITDAQDRAQCEKLAAHIGTCMHEMIYAYAQVSHLVRDIKFGSQPSQYKIINRPNQDLKHLAASRLVSIVPERKEEEKKEENKKDEYKKEEKKKEEAKQPQPFNMLSQMLSSFGMGMGLPQQPQPQAQAQPQQPNANPMLNSVLGMLRGMLGEETMALKLSDMMQGMAGGQTNSLEFITEIAGDLSINDLLQFLTGNTDELFVKIIPKIKSALLKHYPQIATEEGKVLATKAIKEFVGKMVVVPNDVKPMIKEGFDAVACMGNSVSNIVLKMAVLLLPLNTNSKAEILKSIPIFKNELLRGFYVEMSALRIGFNGNAQNMFAFIKKAIIGMAVANGVEPTQMMMLNMGIEYCIEFLKKKYLELDASPEFKAPVVAPSIQAVESEFPMDEAKFLQIVKPKIEEVKKLVKMVYPHSKSYKESSIFYSSMSDAMYRGIDCSAINLDSYVPVGLEEAKIERDERGIIIISIYNERSTATIERGIL
jgi:hypothetical protein